MSTASTYLVTAMARYYDDPFGWVMFSFPWDTDPDLQLVPLQGKWAQRYPNVKYGPDLWACEVLDEIGRQVKQRQFNGKQAVNPIRIAISSGHGVGKSTLSAWIVNWIMGTRPNCKGTVTANTYNQLESKTWAQIAYWHQKSIISTLFKISTGKGNMKLYHAHTEGAWQVKAETSDENNSESFAGQHAANSTSFYIFDEASAISDKVYEVSEGGLTDGEPMIFLFGNPTRSNGGFYDSFHKLRHRWTTYMVDSRTTYLTNKQFIKQMIEDYGEDSDRVKKRVRGIFPNMSIRQFIKTSDVDAAQKILLRPEQIQHAPKIITCDPAWEGDDELVIAMRQGLHFQILKTMEKNDNDVYVANLIARFEEEHQADAVFIDAAYGTGIKSAGTVLNKDWMLVWFGGKANNPGYLNKRSEMWGAIKDWLKEGGALPNDKELYSDLINADTIPRMDGKIQLESKKDMKARGLPSPNKGDALALSFAYHVTKKTTYRPGALNAQERSKGHDPLAKW
jgi:hypothetical protein